MTILARRKLLTQLRDLDAYLGVVVAKNCGAGPGGFQRGNTCATAAHRNSAAGSKRRRKAGKRRRLRGPNSGVGAKTRATRRQKRGANRQAQREWELRSEKPDAAPEHRSLADSHLEGRRDKAEEIRAEREDLHESIRNARADLAQTIRGERADNALDRRRDRGDMRRRQRREVASLESAQTRQFARLEAYHGRQLSRSRHPERLAARQMADRERIAEQHRDGLADQRETHRFERAELRQQQRDARESEREDWRSQIEERHDEDRSERFGKHREWREQLHELHQEQRRERLEFERDARRAAKSYSWVDAKATPDDGVPGAQAILDGVLAEMGHAEAWPANSLSASAHVELLHAVRLEGRRWFRDQATKVLDEIDSLGSKALFGDAASKVKGFFGKARKYVRELFVAGVLAFAGPTPMDAAELRALDEQVAVQHAYLKTFESESVRANKPPDAAFVARAEKYGAAVWGGAQEILRAGAKAERRYTSERRIHQGHDRPCEVCLEQMELEWQPIGTLRPIGDSPCMMNCHCIFIYGWGDSTRKPVALDSDAKSFAIDLKAHACRDVRGRLVFRRAA